MKSVRCMVFIGCLIGILSIKSAYSANQLENLHIGALVPVTGRMALVGQTALATLEIAKQDFQKNYAITMELSIEDTASDPEQALAKLQQLDQQGIRVVVGPFSSSEVLKVKPYADEHQILLLSPTSTAPSLALDDMVFRLTADDSKQAEALIHYVQDRQYQAILPIYRDDLYGQELFEQFKIQFEQVGGTILGPVTYAGNSVDFQSVTTQLNTILQQNSGQSIAILAITYDEIVDLFNAASGDNLLSSVPWLGTDATSKNDAITQDPVAAAFAIQTQFTASISTTGAMSHPYLPFLNYLENTVTKVRQLNNSILEPYVAAIYDSLWLAGIALSEPTNPDIKSVLTEKSQNLLGLTGAIDFNASGDQPYCFFGFYRMINLSNTPTWTIVASYRISKYGSIQPYAYREFIPDGQDKILKVGLLLTQSGGSANMGMGIEKSLKKAESDINTVYQRYISPNSRIEFTISDTQSNPDIALAKLKEMHQAGIDWFIGPLSSAELTAVAPYVNENEIFLISPSSTAMSLAQNDNIFRLTLTDTKQAKALAALIQQEGYDNVDILYRDDTYGSEFYTNFKQHFSELGKQCGEGTSFAPDTTDFSGTLTQFENQVGASIAQYGAQKTAVLVVCFDEGASILETLAQSNSILATLRWFATDGLAVSSVFDNRPLAASMAVQVGLTASILGTHTGEDTLFYTQAFLHDLEDSIQKIPSGFEVAAYDAAWIFAQYPFYVDWTYPTSFAENRDKFLQITKKSVGYLNVNFLDDMGDRLYGNIDFYKIESNQTQSAWNRIATYAFFVGPEILTYLNEHPSSLTPDWDLLK